MIGVFVAELLADIVGRFVGRATYDAVDGRKRSRAAGGRLFRGGVRVVSGVQAGLGSEWLLGDWRVSAGRLSLGAVDLPIAETVRGSRRRALAGEFANARDIVVHTARTGTAEVEWALLGVSDDLALRALKVPESA